MFQSTRVSPRRNKGIKNIMAKQPQKTIGYHGNKNAAVPNPRTHKLTVRLTRDEHTRVAAAAAVRKLPTAEYARSLLLAEQ